MQNNSRNTSLPLRLLAPVLAGFFVIGFCDMVAPVSAHIAVECTVPWQRTAVVFLPSMVFLWFLLLATPVAAAMRRVGRKRVAMAGYGLTFAGLAIPFLAGRGCAVGWYFVGFGLLGIGNTVLQVAVNPMLACLAPPERMSGYLTVGQIFRNTSLLLVAPLVTLATTWFGSWNLLLPLYAVLTLVAAAWMQLTRIPDSYADLVGELPQRAADGLSASSDAAAPSGFSASDRSASEHPAPVVRPASSAASSDAFDPSVRSVSAAACFRLLRLPLVRIGTLGVALFIMADVANGFLSARLIPDPSSLLTSTGYYACRIVGTLVGARLLQRMPERRYLRLNLAAALLLTAALLVVRDIGAIYACMGLLGFTFAGLVPAFYAVATKGAGREADGAAGLLVMAISAGALSGPACGLLIGLAGDAHVGMFFAGACLVGMWLLTRRLPRTCESATGALPSDNTETA